MGLLDDIGEFDLNSLYDEDDIPIDLDDFYNSSGHNISDYINDEEDDDFFFNEYDENEFS